MAHSLDEKKRRFYNTSNSEERQRIINDVRDDFSVVHGTYKGFLMVVKIGFALLGLGTVGAFILMREYAFFVVGFIIALAVILGIVGIILKVVQHAHEKPHHEALLSMESAIRDTIRNENRPS